MTNNPTFHPAYFTIRFHTDAILDQWPEHFFIITAYATTGETWSDERNTQADNELYQELLRLGHTPIRITGFDPESGHGEPGWAVDLPEEEALTLGRTFRQDAIYRVDGDVLTVAHCSLPTVWVHVGTFHERIVTIPSGDTL
jgi:hypothetical protein